jgi:hypothetical protein
MIYEISFFCFATLCVPTESMRKHRGDIFITLQECQQMAEAIQLSPGSVPICADQDHVVRWQGQLASQTP